MIAYDLFEGAGGARAGLVEAGYEVTGFEKWTVAADTADANYHRQTGAGARGGEPSDVTSRAMTAQERPDGNERPSGGRPSDLDRLIDPGDGRPSMPLADRLVELRGMGYSVRRAVHRCGIRIPVFDRWQREAATGERRLAAYYGEASNGTDPDGILTAHQARCMAFCIRFDQAWVTYVAGLHATLRRLAAGAIDEEVVTERSYTAADGTVVTETTTRRSKTLPDREAALALLRSAAPEEFGAKVQVDVVESSGRSSGAELADLLDAYLEGVAAGQDRETEAAEPGS